MFKNTIYLLLIGLCLLFSCSKILVGNKECLEYRYNYPDGGGPSITDDPIKQSAYIHVENASATDIGNGVVEIVLEGVRVESKRNNFSITDFEIEEKEDGEKRQRQFEFSINPTSEKTNLAAVLVLDMSTSISEANLTTKVKQYAKDFAREVTNSTDGSKVSVVFFSGKNAISSTDFYTRSNIGELFQIIDDFSNFQARTALFQATKIGLDLLHNLSFTGAKALVVFTDGGDNDSDNASSLESDIEADGTFRIAIGLKGEDFNKDDLKTIASERKYLLVVKKEKDLEDIFDEVAKRVTSVYKIVYSRSDQKFSESIKIRFIFKVDVIKD